MQNKILILTTILCGLFAVPALSQQKPLDFSIKAYGGYGILTPGNDAVTYENPVYSGEQLTGYQFKTSSLKLGQAPHFGAGLNLGLNELFTVGIDADYLTGTSKNTFPFSNGSLNSSVSASYHVFSIIPNVTYKLYHKAGFDIYNTIGLVLGTNTKLNFVYAGNGAGRDTYKFGLNTGFKDAAGIKFGLAKNIYGFAEVSGYFLGATPSSLTYTTADGTTTVTYKSSGKSNRTETTSGGQDNLTYTQAPADPFHFSSVGLNIGVIIGIK